MCSDFFSLFCSFPISPSSFLFFCSLIFLHPLTPDVSPPPTPSALSLSHRTPPFCFPVSAAAEIKLTSIPVPCWYFRAQEPDQFRVLLAEAGERWDTASSKGEGAGRQHKGHSEEAGRARLHGEQEHGSDMETCGSIHRSPCCVSPLQGCEQTAASAVTGYLQLKRLQRLHRQVSVNSHRELGMTSGFSPEGTSGRN